MTDGHAAMMFDRQAAGYDAQRRRLIPPFDAFYGTAVEAIGLLGGPPKRVLDLGAGTGLLSRAVAAAYPDTALTLVDAAPAMLERARAELGDGPRYVTADLAGPLPDGGPWCAVVSALAIHHLDDDGKRALFDRVHDGLAPGGVFVNAEQVAGPSARFDAAYRAWHRERATRAGSSAQEWAGAEERMAFDRCADAESQLAWMRDAGFDADCLFKDHQFAVLVGRRPTPEP
jgi:tRNA (cmo5U34)-methyltransferase